MAEFHVHCTDAFRRQDCDGSQTFKRRLKIWGSEPGDLQTVYITMRETNNIKVPSTFSEVHFKKFSGRMNQTNAIVKTYYNCCLQELTDDIEEDLVEIENMISPLRDLIEPLGNMVPSLPRDTSTWDIFEDDVLPLGLCWTLRKAFLFNMNETHGKDAFSSLLKEVVQYLGFGQTLSVTTTGPSSRVTEYATSVAINVIPETSSSDSQSSREEKVKTLLNPQARQIINSSNLSPELAINTDSYCKKKLCTEDVLVYLSPEKQDSPIKTLLVVSVKHGQSSDEAGLLTALMSRLPYQDGPIFGLLINAIEATLYSVECVKDLETQSDVVNVSVYQGYSFCRKNEPFSVKSLWNLIRDIAFLLKKQS